MRLGDLVQDFCKPGGKLVWHRQEGRMAGVQAVTACGGQGLGHPGLIVGRDGAVLAADDVVARQGWRALGQRQRGFLRGDGLAGRGGR